MVGPAGHSNWLLNQNQAGGGGVKLEQCVKMLPLWRLWVTTGFLGQLCGKQSVRPTDAQYLGEAGQGEAASLSQLGLLGWGQGWGFATQLSRARVWLLE